MYKRQHPGLPACIGKARRPVGKERHAGDHLQVSVGIDDPVLIRFQISPVDPGVFLKQEIFPAVTVFLCALL